MANKLGGLLSFDPDDPNSQGLLGLGAALLQASGPSREPVSMGQALGQGLQGMQQARGNAIQQQMMAARMNTPNGDPSSVAEWKYFSSLPPQEQARYLEMKRNPNMMNLGGEIAVRAPGGGIGERYQVTPKPEQRPEFRAAQVTAETKAKADATLGADLDKKAVQAGNMADYIKQAESLLDKASGSYLGAAASKTKQAFGVSDETTQANQQLKLISGWMVSNVPRMEGPQSEYDVRNYMEMAGKVGDETTPIGDRKAALRVLMDLQRKYLRGGQPQAATTPAQAGGDNVITVDW